MQIAVPDNNILLIPRIFDTIFIPLILLGLAE